MGTFDVATVNEILKMLEEEIRKYEPDSAESIALWVLIRAIIPATIMLLIL